MVKTRDPIELAHRLALARVPGVGSIRLRALLAHFGSAKTAWEAAPADLPPELALPLAQTRRATSPEAEWEAVERAGVWAILDTDPDYPTRLKHVQGAPPVLFGLGDPAPLSLPAQYPSCSDMGVSSPRVSILGNSRSTRGQIVAIVGTRRSTPYGERQAARIATACAKAGITVISGLAEGIDAVSHSAAIAAGGLTAAVLGSGPEICWPARNRALYKRMRDTGMPIVSEYPPGTEPEKWRFPARNRLVAAIASAVVVVEAPENSGALITARLGAKHGPVFVVPGAADAPSFAGSHALIRDGATLATGPEELFADLGWSGPERTIAPAQGLIGLAVSRVYAAITDVPATSDEVAERLALPVCSVVAALTALELEAMIARRPGGTFSRQR